MDHKPDIGQVIECLPQLNGLEFLSEGGFKAVFKAQLKGQWEAVKVVYLPPETDENGGRDEIVARVKREIAALTQCQTNCLVSLGSLELQVKRMGNHDYLVYSEELLPGESLRPSIRAGQKPNFAELRTLAKSLMKALQSIEASGHIHRDIKPDNIMATGLPERPFVILDLGIAFKVHGTELTARNAGPPGTMIYMAPELFSAQYKDVLDIRSDIYSAGVTLYEYAAGEHPFARRGEDQYTTFYRIMNQMPGKLFNKRNDLPQRFCGIIDRCFKKLPALRYPNPGTVLRELEAMI